LWAELVWHHRFSAIKEGADRECVKILRQQYETSVVPREFFEQPEHFRIGFCGATEALRGGLERLGAALERFQADELT